MASYTSNLNLKKPAGSENVAIGDINGNMDTIDANLGPLVGSTKWADWQTVNNYTNGESWNGSYYTKIGKVTYLRISVKGLTANTQTDIFTLPSGYRPLMATEFDGFGGAAYLNHAHFVISDTGAVKVYSADAYATGFVAFPSA